MTFFYEIFPVFLFFLAFKFYDMYVATTVGIVATLVQVIVNRLYAGKWDKKQLIALIIFTIFGGLTLYFHNPIFVKWKPTVIFWIFAIALMGSQLFTNKSIIERLMEGVVEKNIIVPKQVWQHLNLLWTICFLILGGINIYIAYTFSNEIWVNFKFYGITGAILLVSIIQTIYLIRYLSHEK